MSAALERLRRFWPSAGIWRLPALSGIAATAMVWCAWYFTKIPCLPDNAVKGLCNPGWLARFINAEILVMAGGAGIAVATLKGGYDYYMLKNMINQEREARLKTEQELRDLIFELRDELREARTKAEEYRQRLEDERRQNEEKRRQADEERRQADEARRQAEAEERRLAAENRQRLEEERRQADDERRQAEAEERRLAAENRQRLEEERRQAEEVRRQAEAEERRLAAEDRQRFAEQQNQLVAMQQAMLEAIVQLAQNRNGNHGSD